MIVHMTRPPGVSDRDWAAHEDALFAPCPGPSVHVRLYQAVRRALDLNWHEDGYADVHVIDLCRAARALLNMDTGRLDCGAMDAYYCAAIKACGGEP